MARQLVSVDETTKALPAAVVTANQGTTSGTLAAGNDSRITEAQPAATMDTAIAAKVNDGASTTRAALSAVYGSKARTDKAYDTAGSLLPRRAHLPEIRSLICGSDDETITLAAGNGANTVTADTANYKVGDRGWKLHKVGASEMIAVLTLPTSPLVLPAVQAFGFWFYISDVTSVTGVTLRVYHDAGFTTGERFQWASSDTVLFGNTYTGTNGGTLQTGWNFMRISHNHSTPGVSSTAWGTIHKLQININSTADVDVTIGHLYAESPHKARLLLVADRGYKTFLDYAYPLLKAAGIPVTFAVDVNLFGYGDPEVPPGISMTEAEIDAVAWENGNSVSFHAYGGVVTSTMTAAQLRADTMKCIKWLQDKGYDGRMWRAAFTANDAPQWAALRPYLLGARSATWTEPKIRPWPCIDMMKLPYWAIDNSTGTTGTIDAQFALLEKRRGVMLPFMHGISSYQWDVAPALFDYFLAKIQAAVTAGWLECVTFESAYRQMGGSFSSAAGATLATWTDQDGTVITKRMP